MKVKVCLSRPKKKMHRRSTQERNCFAIRPSPSFLACAVRRVEGGLYVCSRAGERVRNDMDGPEHAETC
jgi:hypothetical protein